MRGWSKSVEREFSLEIIVWSSNSELIKHRGQLSIGVSHEVKIKTRKSFLFLRENDTEKNWSSTREKRENTWFDMSWIIMTLTIAWIKTTMVSFDRMRSSHGQMSLDDSLFYIIVSSYPNRNDLIRMVNFYSDWMFIGDSRFKSMTF